MDTTTTANRYDIEGWNGLDCVAFSTGRQARTIARLAGYYTLDLGADRLYVRQGGVVVATYTNGGWQSVTDARLQATLDGDL